MSATRARLTALALLAVAAVPVTACGGGSSSPGPAPGSPENPLVAKTEPPDEPDSSRPATGTKLPSTPHQAGGSRSSTAPQETTGKRSQPATTGTETRAAGGSASGPCRLVTEAQAQAIFGEPVQAPIVAKQGPTCIYRTRSGRRFLTLTVQATRLSTVKKDLRKPHAVAVSNHTGYCGTLGQPMLYVPVGTRRVLAISASCGVATKFAARAVPHLVG